MDVNVTEDICYICRDNNDETSITLPCKHKYHKSCIEQSIKLISSECPYCRRYVNLQMVRSLITYTRCKGIIKSGVHKGEQCKCNAKHIYNGYCGRHKKKDNIDS